MKIKQYINERPKLKKALKITAVIGAIFSIGLNILVFGSLAVSCSQVKANETIEKNAPVKSAYHNNTYDCNLYYWGSDLGNTEFYRGLLETYNKTEAGEWYPLYVTDLVDVPVGDWETIRFETTSGGSLPLGFMLAWNDFTTPQQMETYSNQNRGFNAIKISVTSVVNHNFTYGKLREISLRVDFLLSGTSIENCSSVAKFYLNSNNGISFYEIQPLNTYNYYVLTNKTIHEGFGSTALANDMFDQIYTQSKTYKAGYDKGYQIGYDAGFNYEDGQSTAFSVITNAFNSVAGFMNIQVLPHLTLGVLLFAPIVVTLIIVIIKMFRG